MAAHPHPHAHIAATRFGLGPRPGELAAVQAVGPRAWLKAQLTPAAEAPLGELPSSREQLRQLARLRQQDDEGRQQMREAARGAFRTEQAAHLAATASSELPFRERLVAFWSNHFTVSITRGIVVGIVGAFEREVVRGHLDRSFDDMLVAGTRHPAMLAYLDNVRSIGPGSLAGTRGGRGLNENLAREVLELHTLGVGGGYHQTDVEALAKVLTGWSIDRSTGAFAFASRRHEPGPKRVLGRSYGAGEAAGVEALRALAAHPATARHLATKLVRHFVADDPPPSAVARIAEVFTASGGLLPAVHAALVDLDEAFAAPLTKVKTPWDLVVSTARALDQTSAGEPMLAALRYLGQLPHQAPSPQGWPDVAEAWLGPEAILSRLDWVEQAARTIPAVDAMRLAEAVLGPVLTPATRAAVAAREGPEALALVLASPEFQRR